MIRTILATCLLLLAVTNTALAESSRDAPYAALLTAYVHDGVVDYAGLKTREKDLDAYLDVLAAVDPSTLNRQEQFAYYINVYNAWTIKLILEHYPGIRSIKEAGSFFRSPWKRDFVRLQGKTVSLDDVEQGILRPQFHDPRVHFAINCASKSCPPLRGAPYVGESLDASLDAAARAFVNNPANTFFKDGKLHVSRIFAWYGEDFGGPKSVWGFIRHYADPELAARMEAAEDHDLDYLPYDWSLNGQ